MCKLPHVPGGVSPYVILELLFIFTIVMTRAFLLELLHESGLAQACRH